MDQTTTTTTTEKPVQYRRHLTWGEQDPHRRKNTPIGMWAWLWQRISALLIVLGGMILNVGIGCAFAALPNLVISAVEPHETGEATGVNMIARNVGAALGGQVAASIVAGHAAACCALSTVSSALACSGVTPGFIRAQIVTPMPARGCTAPSLIFSGCQTS